PPHNSQVKEANAVACFYMCDSNIAVDLPPQMRQNCLQCKDSGLLHWVKPEALELPHLSPTDVISQDNLVSEHEQWGPLSIYVT
ncbi:hypothetical protein BD410DRAFT_681570, partial [Rickenella mellea]